MTHLSSGNPSAGVHVHLLDDVTLDGQTAIILGLLPLELDVVGADLLREERSLGAVGLGW